jgi:hypothetical protein
MIIKKKGKQIWMTYRHLPESENRTRFYLSESTIWPRTLSVHCDHRVRQDIIDEASKYQETEILEFRVHRSAYIVPFFAESLDLSPFRGCEKLTEVRIRDVYGPIDLGPLPLVKTLNIIYDRETLLEGIMYEDDETIEYFQNRVVFPESEHLESVVIHGGVGHDRKSLAEYPRLRELTINHLRDTDLSWLSKAKSIELLKLPITLPDRVTLPEIASLRELSVGFVVKGRKRRRRSLKTLDLSPLSGLKGLETLQIMNQRIESINLSPLSTCKSLTSIQITGCALRDVDISPLSCIPLDQLTLANNLLHSLTLPVLPHLTGLQVIGNKFQRFDLSTISKSKNFRGLLLAYNQLIELDLTPLSGLSKLNYLDLRNNRFKALDLSPLKGMDGIHIDLSRNKYLKEVDVTPLLEQPETVVIPARGMRMIASEQKRDCFASSQRREKMKFVESKIEWY